MSFSSGGINYVVTSATTVRVGISSPLAASYNIPLTVTNGPNTYSVTSIGNAAFQNYLGLTSVTIPNSVISIEDSAFFGCSALTSITIPNSVTSIGISAFQYCSALTGQLTIPNSVTSIGINAFVNCSGLTGLLTIPNSLTSIGNSVFQGCSGLTSVTIPNSVTSIASQAFFGCSGLTSITIPNSVISIGDFAFFGCSGLTSVICNTVTPLGISANVFTGVNQSACTLMVPVGTVGAYQSAPVWQNFNPITDKITVNAVVNSSTQVTVNFTDLTNGEGATDYNIYVVPDGSPQPTITTPISATVPVAPSPLQATVSGLMIPNAEYDIWVFSINGSNILRTGFDALISPDPPGVTAVATSPTQVTVTITPPTNTGGSPITQYDVITLLSTDPAPLPIAPTGTIVSAGPNIITGLLPNTAYTFYVRATNSDGYRSLFGSASATTFGNLNPDPPGVTAVATSPTQVTVTITPPTNTGGSPITQYDVITLPSGSPAPNQSTPTGIIVFAGPNTIGGLFPISSYDFYVRATNSAGFSSSFGLASATTLPSPSPAPAPSPVCYAKGTLIGTSRGMIPIEKLLMSDKLRTYDRIEESMFKPVHGVPVKTLTRVEDTRFKNRFSDIKFIGHFTVNIINEHTAPICISKNALGHSKPEIDLLVSPNHSMLLGNRLIYAKNLVNGNTIYQDMSFEKIEYFHVLSDDHYIINANGAMSETLGSEEIAIFEALESLPVHVEIPTNTKYDFKTIHIKEDVEVMEFELIPEYNFTEMAF
jgi:hypothetical protein